MMHYTIEITGKSCSPIKFDSEAESKVFESLDILIDTVDENVNDRSTNVLNRVTLKVKIDETTSEQCKLLMEWALMSKNEDVHRVVQIDIENTRGETVRSFRLEEMFVEDYAERYGKEDGGDYFELKLIQKAGKAERFHHGNSPQ